MPIVVVVWLVLCLALIGGAGLMASRLSSTLAATSQGHDPMSHERGMWPMPDPRVRRTLQPFEEPHVEALRRQMLFWLAAGLVVGIGGGGASDVYDARIVRSHRSFPWGDRRRRRDFNCCGLVGCAPGLDCSLNGDEPRSIPVAGVRRHCGRIHRHTRRAVVVA